VSTLIVNSPAGSSAVSGNRRADRTQDKTMWVAVTYQTSPSTIIRWYYSKDNGISWVYSGTDSDLDYAGLGTGNVVVFIDLDDFIHVLTASGIALMYSRGTPNPDRTAWTWANPIALDAYAGLGSNVGADLVAHREGTGWKVHVVAETFVTASDIRVGYESITIASDGTSTPSGTRNDIFAGTTSNQQPFLDFHHTGDGKTVAGSAPHLYAGASRAAGLLYRRAAYSAGAWTWGTTRTIDATSMTGSSTGVYDGTRIMMGTTTSAAAIPTVWERDEADTTSTARSPTDPGDITTLRMGYDSGGNIFMLGRRVSDNFLLKNRFSRSGLTWGGWSAVESVASSGTHSITRGPGLDTVAMFWRRSASTDGDVVFEALVTEHKASAFLQGVGSLTPSATLAIAATATLQGVGSISAVGNMVLAASARLQGVGLLSPRATLIPKRDFTVYDGYVVDPNTDETLAFIYHDSDQTRKDTGTVPLRPARQDVGNDPTEVRPESGDVFSQQDFSHGAGQLYFHHEGRDVRKFLWSEGYALDVDTVGQPSILEHLHNVPSALRTSATVGRAEVFNDLLFVADGTSVYRWDSSLTGPGTAEDPGGTVQDLASSGEYLYAAMGASGIHRRDTAGAWTHWSDVLATRVAWVKSRIMASNGVSVYEVVAGGAAPGVLETLPAGWTFEDIFEAGGFVYAVAVNVSSGLSRIHTYGLNSAQSALEKKSETPFPRYQLMYSGRGYLGVAYIGGGIKNPDGGFDPVVYQAFPNDDGSLTYTKIAEGEGAGAQDLSVLSFEPDGEDVVMGWSLGSGFDFGARDGLAIYKLRVGAFMPYLKKAGAGSGRQVVGLVAYRGRMVFVLKGDGVYVEDPTTYVQDAYVISSIADWQTTSLKAWDLFQVSHAALPAATTVRLDYTTKQPAVGDWTLVVTSATAGEEVAEARVPELSSRIIAIRIRSTADTARTSAPSGPGFFIRSNLLPDNPEYQLVRYVRVLDRDRKDDHAPTVFADPLALRRSIDMLAHKWVTLYEPGVTWSVRVNSVREIEPMGPAFEQTTGESRRNAFLIQVALSGTRD
jgi:hypothetical protein